MQNLVTDNKTIPAEAKRDLVISLITLKYTQSNSVCYAKTDRQSASAPDSSPESTVPALAGNKADIWFLRQHPKVLALPFKEDIRRADRDNTIDVYISDDYEDVIWQTATGSRFFTEQPHPLTREEKKDWLGTMTGVALGSDAFFPFGDNIERAHRSGVEFIAQPGGSIRDDNVIETCNKYGISMAFTGIRLFHH